MSYLSCTSSHSLFYFSPLIIACQHEPVALNLRRWEAPPLLILLRAEAFRRPAPPARALGRTPPPLLGVSIQFYRTILYGALVFWKFQVLENLDWSVHWISGNREIGAPFVRFGCRFCTEQTEATLRAGVFCWAGRLEYLTDTTTCYMGWLAAVAVTREREASSSGVQRREAATNDSIKNK
jgi:hypothetical protein